MKAFERIFLYSLLAVLIFYVFLVGNKVESQVAIQEEIRARRIVIVNGAGQEVVELGANKNGGIISVANNEIGAFSVYVFIDEHDNGMIAITNKFGISVAEIGVYYDSGAIGVKDKYGIPVASMGIK